MSLALSLPAAAQLRGGGGITLDGATLIIGDGTTLPRGGVHLTGTRIGMVGETLDATPRARHIDASGKFITPGFIDVWSTVGLRSFDSGRSSLSSAADAFDRFARHEIDATVHAGVTTVYLPSRSNSGVGGVGVVIRLLPEAAATDWLLKPDAALNAALGIDERQSALDRVKAAGELTKAFREARTYRTAQEDYDLDLKEYEEKLKKRSEESRKEEDRKGEGDEKKDKAGSAESGTRGEAAGDAWEEGVDSDLAPTPTPRRPDRSRARPDSQGASAPSGRPDDKGGKKDDLKKPAEVGRDRQKDRLLEVVDGKIPLRVEAHRPEDILNAIEMAREQNIALILEGASGGDRVAGTIAKERVPVILGSDPPPMLFVDNPRRYSQPAAAATLARAGVDVFIGSGPAAEGSAAARHLRLALARAVGEGLDPQWALRSVTGEAAKLLGVGGDIGRIAPGLYADLVVWSGDPLAPDTIVERVFIRGREVYSVHEKSPDKREEPADEPPASAAATAESASRPSSASAPGSSADDVPTSSQSVEKEKPE